MALPATYNLQLYQGDAWHISTRIRALDEDGDPADYVDLTDVEPKAQIRDLEGSLMAEITCELGDQDDDDEVGLVNLSLLSEVTSDFTENGKWDFQLDFGGGEIRTYLKGNVTVTSEVTKP